MHGLILRTFQVFVQDTYGQQTWLKIVEGTSLDVVDFEGMLNYAPETYDTVIAATEKVLRKPRDAFLEDVGTYLVSHPNSEGLRRLLRFGGVDFIEFMHSLDDLSDRAMLVVTDLVLPTMAVDDNGEGQFLLKVGRGLPGFGNVMVGVLRAIADDYGALVLLDAEPEGPQGQVVEITLIETSFAEGRSFELAGQLRAAGESA